MNSAQVSGRITDRGVTSRAAGQSIVYNATVVNERKVKDKTYSTYIEVSGWNERGAGLAQFGAGDYVLVQGTLKTESWDDKDTGKKRYKMIVDVDNVVGIMPPAHRAPPATQEAQPSFGDLPF